MSTIVLRLLTYLPSASLAAVALTSTGKVAPSLRIRVNSRPCTEPRSLKAGKFLWKVAIEHYGVEPDIITMAKGIADGWPLSAFIARPEIADAFQLGDHLSTFGGNPVSCAASLANIEFMEETGLVEQSARKGAALKARFEELQRAQPLIGEVRGKGLMIGVELVADQQTKAYGTAAAGFVRQYCLEHNLLIGVGGNFGSVLRIQPPLVISDAQLETVFATVADGLAAFAKS